MAMLKLALAADRVSDTLKAAEALLRVNARDAEALKALPGLYLRQMNPGRAEQLAHAALKLHPRDAGLRIDLARALEGQKNPLAAAQVLQEAIRLDPSHIGAVERLAALHLKSDRTLAARAVLEEALQRHPHNPRLNWNAGELYRSEGRTEKSVEMYEQALTFSPAVQTAIAAAQETDRAMNLEQARQATRSEPTNATAWRLHGVAANAMGLKEEAANSLQRALQLDPHDMRAAGHAGPSLRAIAPGAVRL